MAESTFSQYPPASWEVPGKPVVIFPFVKVETSLSKRLVGRARAYRDGEKQDNTGLKATRYTVTGRITQNCTEPGVTTPFPYPDLINAFQALFREHETGNLTLPRQGLIRCQFETMTIAEGTPGLDVAEFTAAWVEDNEDTQTAASFQQPGARSVSILICSGVADTGEATGAWNGSMGDFAALGGRLQAIAGTPSRFLDDTSDAVNEVIDVCDGIEGAFTSAVDELSSTLLSPRAVAATWGLVRMKDLAMQTRAVATRDAVRTRQKRYTDVVSLSMVAVREDQDESDIASLNRGRFENERQIPAGSTIYVLA